jgi:ATP-dependent DNA helicase RecG
VLPFGLTPADLFKPHPSRPWNLLIAQTFYRLGIIEAWGRGTLKMAALMEQAGLPPPEYEIVAGEVLVRFRNGGQGAPAEPAKHTLLQEKILAALGKHGPCSVTELLGHLRPPVPRRTVLTSLKLLRDSGFVFTTGASRSLRWNLKK